MVSLIIFSGVTEPHGDPTPFIVLPLFLMVGLYFTFGRFFMAYHARSLTQYYLTERRAIIRQGIFRRSEQSINLAANSEVRLAKARDGTGTIEFGAGNPFTRMMPRSWEMGMTASRSPAFERIDDPDAVYRQALDLGRGGGAR